MEPITAEVVPAEPWDKELFNYAARQIIRDAQDGVTGAMIWHYHLQKKYDLHPTVTLMLKHPPHDYKKMLLEWPHVSETDTERLAYTRTVKDGEADRQLVTSIGKYLAKHWPQISDHERRDALMLYTPDKMNFIHTVAEFVEAANNGPSSCMAHNDRNGGYRFDHKAMVAWLEDKTKPEPDWTEHPYSCYDPKHGWLMAVRHGVHGIDGRAVLLHHDDQKIFVRTFARNKDEPFSGYSHADQMLEPWLKAQGYKHVSEWPEGAKLTTSRTKGTYGNWRAPYLDGGNQTAALYDAGETLIIAEDGELSCNNTSGIASDRENDDDDEDNQECCECCDRYYDRDGMYWAGRDESTHVCENCLENNYTDVRGRNNVSGRGYITYYVENDTAYEVYNCDYYVDENHLPENIVPLEDTGGDYGYAERDDCVCIDDAWYPSDDDEIVQVEEDHEENGLWALKDDCWIDGNDKWHRDDIESTEPDESGDRYVLDETVVETIVAKPKRKSRIKAVEVAPLRAVEMPWPFTLPGPAPALTAEEETEIDKLIAEMDQLATATTGIPATSDERFALAA